jgi:hypothetical protein
MKKATGDGAVKAPTRDDQATLPDAGLFLRAWMALSRTGMLKSIESREFSNIT